MHTNSLKQCNIDVVKGVGTINTMHRSLIAVLATLLPIASVLAPSPAFAATGDPVTTTVTTNWGKHQTMQLEMFNFRASAGPVTFSLTEAANGPVTVGVYDPATETGVTRVVLTPTTPKGFTFNLDAAGDYQLVVDSLQNDSFTLTGIDLEMNTSTPAMKLTVPDSKPSPTLDGTFTVSVQVMNPTETELVDLMLDETSQTWDGDPLAPAATIDTSKLAEGLHTILVGGQGLASVSPLNAANASFAGYAFVVDRVDSFPDVIRDHWARPSVEVMHDKGILNGRETGKFDPTAPVTRAEFAKMIALALDLEVPAEPALSFVDVGNNWWTPHINALAAAGFMEGEVIGSDRYFHPESSITRAEAATVLARVLGLDKAPFGGEAPFSDYAQVPTWAQASVVHLAGMSWINGYPGGTFKPAGTLNRAEAAKLLAKFVGM